MQTLIDTVSVLILLILIYHNISWIEAINYDTVTKNSQSNRTEFMIESDNQSIVIPNHHRHKESLFKFTLSTSEIKKPIEEQLDDSKQTWNLALNNDANVHLTVKNALNLKITEYFVVWFGGEAGQMKPKVCFSLEINRTSWFSTIVDRQNEALWPMAPQLNQKPSTLNAIKKSVSIVEHLYLNTNGFALMLDHYASLLVSFESHNSDQAMCVLIEQDSSLQEQEFFTTNDIKFTMFSGSNIKTVYEAIVNDLALIPKPTAIPNDSLFMYPAFVFDSSLNQSSVLSFVNEARKHKFKHASIVLGNLLLKTLTQSGIQENKKLVSDLHHLGNKVAFAVSSHAPMGLNISKDYLVNDKSSERSLEFENNFIIDFSNTNACQWFAEYLRKLQTEIAFDSFYFRQVVLPVGNFSLHDKSVQKHSSLFVEKYLRFAAEFGSSTVVENGFKTQDMPLFVRLSDAKWQNDLRTLIPTVLTASLAGYSFVIADFVENCALPTEETYIRWIQAITFLPAIQLSIPPWHYNASVIEIAQKYVNLHHEYAQTFLELSRKRIKSGTPLIIPLWYPSPDDSATYKINNQFMLGDAILVAPVLEPGVRDRVVYLPEGVWADQHGKHFYGPIKMTVGVPLNELSYFRKQL